MNKRKSVVVKSAIITLIGFGICILGLFVFDGISGLPLCVFGGLVIAKALVDLDFEFNIEPAVYGDYNKNIGKKVQKCTIGSREINRKPFKSGLLKNTVKDVIYHPQLNIPAYTFLEDDSYVECRRCEVVTD